MAVKTVTVCGGNLFQIASQYLGDWSQWVRIANLNDTGIDPFLPVGVTQTLKLPTVDATAGGGVYVG